MNYAVHIDSPLTDDERRARLYAGDIFIFSPNPHSLRLIELAQADARGSFKGRDPRKLHETMTVEAVVEVLRISSPGSSIIRRARKSFPHARPLGD